MNLTEGKMIEEFLQKISEELQIPTPEIKKDKSYLLEIAPDIIIAHKDLQPGIYFYTKIAPLPKERQEELLTFLMKNNLLGEAAFGGSIGLDELGNNITISLAVPYEADYNVYKDNLENLVNALCFWQKEIDSFIKAKPLIK